MMKDDLPAHQASYLAAIDYQYNAHRCSASLSSSSSTSNHLPRWIPDIERSQCQLCHLLFDTIQRKHHCRYCCDIFCNSCTKYRIMLPNEYNVREPQRVCQVCYEKLKNKQKQLINHYSNSTRVNNVIVSKQFNLPYSKTLGSEIRKATNTIHQLLNYQDNIIDDKSLRISLLNNAKGIAFLTVLKGGFIFAPRIGTGLVMSRLLDGRWSAPSAIATIGISWGALIGLDMTDYIIVLHDLEAVRAFTGDGQVSLGGELKLSLGGLGRTGAGELLIGDHGLATALSYCHSTGLFAGVSLEGSMLISRSEVNMNFYGRQVTPYQLLSGEVPPPEAANCLYQALSNAIEACDRYYGISQTERQHQDMLKLLDPQNSSKYLPKKENSTNLEDCSASRGIGDQYI